MSQCYREELRRACQTEEAIVSFVSQQAWLVKTIALEMLAHVQRASQSRHAMRLLRLLLGVQLCDGSLRSALLIVPWHRCCSAV